MQTITQLESRAQRHPNSSEIKQALADAYVREQRWEDAAKAYRGLAALYPDTAALFITRIRLGAAALTISSVLILVAALIQPPLPVGDVTILASAIGSTAYLSAQILIILALALYSCSAISIYKLLSYTRDHRPAFWAMALSVIGAGLSMPRLGINAFVFPMLGDMALHGQAEVLDVYFSLNGFPFAFYLGMGSAMLVLSMMIFAWVIWQNRGLSLPAVLTLAAGWLGFAAANGEIPRLFVIAFGALIGIGGVGLGLSLWDQASTQFDATMERSLKA